MQRLGLTDAYQWSIRQPDRGIYFNSLLFVRERGNIAIDPLPLEPDQRRQVDGLGGIASIILTNRDHARAAVELRAAYGAKILASVEEAPLFGFPIDETFGDGAELFPGAFALALGDQKTPGEVAIHLPAEKTAIVGDAMIGTPAGALSLLADEKYADPQAAVLGLRRIWSCNVQTLLLGDGACIFGNADEAIGALLETRGGVAVNRINLDELSWEPFRGGRPKYECSWAEIGLDIGARKLGYAAVILPPGKALCPLHSHEREEEMFFVVEGEPSIRSARGTIECRRGDLIAFPTGERGAHQLLNQSGRDATILVLAAEAPQEICHYPDSDKFGLYPRRLMLRGSPSLDYYDGE